MGLIAALIQQKRPLVGSAYYRHNGITNDEMDKALANAVSFARATRGQSQIIVSTSSDSADLIKYCGKIVASLEVDGEILTVTSKLVTEGTCQVTIIAD